MYLLHQRPFSPTHFSNSEAIATKLGELDSQGENPLLPPGLPQGSRLLVAKAKDFARPLPVAGVIFALRTLSWRSVQTETMKYWKSSKSTELACLMK